MNYKRLVLYTLTILITAPQTIIQCDDKKERTFSNYITNKYLNANFTTEEQPIIPEEKQYENISWFSNKELEKALDLKCQILTARETQESAFSIVSPSFASTNIIEDLVINKLELIGGGENSNKHLMNHLFNNKIHTTIGKAHTAYTLCSPITDTRILIKRQKAIGILSNQQKSSFQKLNSIFKSIQKNESKSLTHWHSKPIIKEEVLTSFYFQFGPFKKLNTSTLALSASYGMQNAMATLFLSIAPLYMYIGLNAAKENISYKAGKDVSYTEVIKLGMSAAKSALKDPETPFWAKGLIVGSPLIIAGLEAHPAFMTKRLMEFLYEATEHIHSILIATAGHVSSLKKLSLFVNGNKQLIQSMPSLKPLSDFNNPKKRSANLNKLLGMLNTNTFKGKPSFWSITGRVLAAHKLMAQVKDELAPVFAAAGELEMYVALAQLYAEQQDENATWCVPTFVENATPIIKAEDFWNPFISPDVVVTNNILFDSEHPNSILTGPNTGGKSTVIKGVMLNVLMAQTFGIAPAHSLTLTPFAKLNCFMNIADDIATGASLFKSEVIRAKELSTMISSLKRNEFSFVIIDEVFTGTSPVEGEIAALRFAKHLATFPNSIAVIATHYPKMTTLEEETQGKFYNHHVEVIRNEDGSLERTYTLKNGPTFVNVALDILEEEGLII